MRPHIVFYVNLLQIWHVDWNTNLGWLRGQNCCWNATSLNVQTGKKLFFCHFSVIKLFFLIDQKNKSIPFSHNLWKSYRLWLLLHWVLILLWDKSLECLSYQNVSAEKMTDWVTKKPGTKWKSHLNSIKHVGWWL